MVQVNAVRLGLVTAFFAFALLAFGGESIAKMQGNPCAAGSRAANPCAAAAGGIDYKLFTRPKGTVLAKGNQAALIKEGERLFKDKSLSTNGSSCYSCHAGFGLLNATFAKPFPHMVSMAKDNGRNKVALDEMIQLCMLAPMEAKALPWGSRKLAALTAYMTEFQKSYIARGKAVNPCAAPAKAMNPCAASPKAMNPCSR
jgi:cytochrome c